MSIATGLVWWCEIGGVKATARKGLPAEAVLRCALLKQYRQLSYQELASMWRTPHRSSVLRGLPWSWSPAEVGAVKDDQRDPAWDLGRDQSGHCCRVSIRRSSKMPDAQHHRILPSSRT